MTPSDIAIICAAATLVFIIIFIGGCLFCRRSKKPDDAASQYLLGGKKAGSNIPAANTGEDFRIDSKQNFPPHMHPRWPYGELKLEQVRVIVTWRGEVIRYKMPRPSRSASGDNDDAASLTSIPLEEDWTGSPTTALQQPSPRHLDASPLDDDLGQTPSMALSPRVSGIGSDDDNVGPSVAIGTGKKRSELQPRDPLA